MRKKVGKAQGENYEPQSLKREGWTISINWGRNGGLCFRRGYTTRLCLWRVALTWWPEDLDGILQRWTIDPDKSLVRSQTKGSPA